MAGAVIERIDRGLYRLSDAAATEHHSRSSTASDIDTRWGSMSRSASLRDFLKKYPGEIDALVQAARADRVYALIRPYLEALA